MTADRTPDGDITDEMLVAFADGEADEATARRIEEALERDAGLAARLEPFVATRRILKRALGDVAREPVPERLTRFVVSGGAVEDATRSSSAPGRAASVGGGRAPERPWAWPMAAAVAGLVAGGVGYLAGSSGWRPPSGSPLVALAAADEALGTLLATAPDGGKVRWSDPATGRGGEVAIRASHRTRAGYCRTYGVTEGAGAAFGGVACRVGDAWKTEVVTAEGQSIGGYAPASGMAKAIEAFLDAADAEDPLAPEAVGERIRSGWR
jgi:anti-sigma factor RsiW